MVAPWTGIFWTRWFMYEIALLADRIVRIEDGRIME